MAKSVVRSGSIIFILFAMLLGGARGLAQEGDGASSRERYFPKTGHNVDGDFLEVYESATNPDLIYGSPITEKYQDPLYDRFIQYFERARFELYTENPPEEDLVDAFPYKPRVRITPLGKLTYVSSTELARPSGYPGCQYYSETKYYVCYDFLDFFKANGGAKQFGYPISNFEISDGWIVQTFQRARFEWHPELPKGQKVQLTDLGRKYFSLMGENPIRLRPVPPSNPILEPLVQDLLVRASFERSITSSSGEQTLYVTVQDQRLMTVDGANVSLVITLPSGLVSTREVLEPTNDKGITMYSFTFNDQPPGLAKVDISVTYNQLKEDTTTSFLIWW